MPSPLEKAEDSASQGPRKGARAHLSDFALSAPNWLAPLGSLELGLQDSSLLTAGFQVTSILKNLLVVEHQQKLVKEKDMDQTGISIQCQDDSYAAVINLKVEIEAGIRNPHTKHPQFRKK